MDKLEHVDQSLVQLLVDLKKLEVLVADLSPRANSGAAPGTLATIAHHREQLLESSRTVCERIGAISRDDESNHNPREQ